MRPVSSLSSHFTLLIQVSRNVIESLGFFPEEPSGDNPYPPCRGFYTAPEAFHYLYRALEDRGMLRPGLRFVSEETPSNIPSNISEQVVIEEPAFANHLEEREVDAQI